MKKILLSYGVFIITLCFTQFLFAGDAGFEVKVCVIKNSAKEIVGIGNTCDLGDDPCIPNPCDQGFAP